MLARLWQSMEEIAGLLHPAKSVALIAYLGITHKA